MVSIFVMCFYRYTIKRLSLLGLKHNSSGGLSTGYVGVCEVGLFVFAEGGYEFFGDGFEGGLKCDRRVYLVFCHHTNHNYQDGVR